MTEGRFDAHFKNHSNKHAKNRIKSRPLPSTPPTHRKPPNSEIVHAGKLHVVAGLLPRRLPKEESTEEADPKNTVA